LPIRKRLTTALILNGVYGNLNRGALQMFQKGGVLEQGGMSAVRTFQTFAASALRAALANRSTNGGFRKI
jgi:hypothetical protein